MDENKLNDQHVDNIIKSLNSPDKESVLYGLGILEKEVEADSLSKEQKILILSECYRNLIQHGIMLGEFEDMLFLPKTGNHEATTD